MRLCAKKRAREIARLAPDEGLCTHTYILQEIKKQTKINGFIVRRWVQISRGVCFFGPGNVKTPKIADRRFSIKLMAKKPCNDVFYADNRKEGEPLG